MSDIVELDGNLIEGDYLDMPDEDLYKNPMPKDGNESIPEASEELVVELGNEEQEVPAAEAEAETADEVEEPSQKVEEVPESDGSEEEETEETEPDDLAAKAEDTEETAEEKPTAELEQVLAPLKAAGQEFQIKSVDELRKLAQMGVDYTKKMQALAPNLKLMKMLENNGLLDSDKLSYLIDLDKKDPKAVAKLLKDSGQDPLDVDLDQAEGYKPNNYTVDDKQMALDNILQELEGSQGFQTTIDTVGNKWDAQSKSVVLEHPEILRDINNHVETGIFELVQQEVNRQKTLGYLSGVSDLQAYKQVGDMMHEQGAFNHLAQQQSPEARPVANQGLAPLTQQPPAQVNKATKDKKRAAALSKGTAPKKATKADYNPLLMDDEDFMKIAQTLQY